jgi:hypothetical protein
LSGEIGLDDIERQKRLIRDRGITVINIIRDGRDVIQSGYISSDRWVSCIAQRELCKDVIAAEVVYEDLVRWPDREQEILSDKLGLRIGRWFSEYPVGYDGQRPIDTRSVGKDWSGLRLSDTFHQALRMAGYGK